MENPSTWASGTRTSDYHNQFKWSISSSLLNCSLSKTENRELFFSCLKTHLFKQWYPPLSYKHSYFHLPLSAHQPRNATPYCLLIVGCTLQGFVNCGCASFSVMSSVHYTSNRNFQLKFFSAQYQTDTRTSRLWQPIPVIHLISMLAVSKKTILQSQNSPFKHSYPSLLLLLFIYLFNSGAWPINKNIKQSKGKKKMTN